MSWLDITLLLSAFGAAIIAVWPRQVHARSRGAVIALPAAFAMLQVLREGFYWQCLPVYALLASAALVITARRRHARGLRITAVAATIIATLATVVCWAVLPVPVLPAPSGQYIVGTTTFRWVQPDRDEPATGRTDDRRNSIVQAWYPAARNTTGVHAPFLDGLGHLPTRVAGIPRFVFAHYDRIDTHAISGAPVSTDRARWPVVLFSPGYGASRAFYTTLLADLASRGVIVLAVDHPYGAALTQLADGQLVTLVERFIPGAPDRLGYMVRETGQRVADLRAVLDAVSTGTQLGALASHLDTTRIVAAGHSFGGAAAVATAQVDTRVRAAVNIDGTMYGSVPDRPLTQPYLLLQSDQRETHHGALFLDGNARLLAQVGARGARVELARTNHYTITDASLLLSPPWRWIAARMIGGSRGTATTVHEVNARILGTLAP